jgi:ferredoxin
MAKLIIDNKEYVLPDGAAIAEVCERHGIPFNCHTGVCGSCQITIVEGAQNLNSVTEEERGLGLDKKRRLACMCKIKKGTVKIISG